MSAPVTVHPTSVLPAPADVVWDAVGTTWLLADVAAPLLTLRAEGGRPLPARWPAGEPVRLRLHLFGAVPLGPHEVVVERADDAARVFQTRERGPLLRRWDHRITVEPAGPGAARYTDEVVIDAGRLTPVVAALARVFFRHRHRRWQAVARRLAASPVHRLTPPSP